MTEGYHYTACGLDYVYLQNGYKIREGKHGKSVSVVDAVGLHEAIARTVIASPARLRGQEVRFLRSQLNFSQEGLAKVLRTKRGSVARWEAAPDKAIPGTADSALRMYYALKADKHELAEKIADLLEEIDEIEHQIAVMENATFAQEQGGEWVKEAA